jgi:hypothetical protein
VRQEGVGAAGRGGGRQRKGDDECYSKTKENPELGNVTWRPEEGHLAPEVKTANEIVCDKLYPHPISVTCSKWHIRNAPFALGAQPLDLSPPSHCWLA